MINEYSLDHLFVGGSLESLLYCYLTNQKLLVINKLYPFELLKSEYHDNFKYVGYTPDDVIHKSELWDRLSFIMSLSGQLVMPNIVTNHRFSDKEMVVVTAGNKRIFFKFDKITFFDEVQSNYNVYDWFNVRSGNNHKYNVLRDESSNFVSSVNFYTPTRIGSNSMMRDLVAVSLMSKKDIEDVNLAEGIVRLKVLKMMKEAGIRGQSNGISANGNKLHYALKIEHTHREIKSRYVSKYNLDTILQTEFNRGDQWNLTKKLFRHKQISTLRESFRLPASL